MKKILFMTMVVGLIAQFFYFTNLPAEVAHNFGQGGLPNRWLTKEAYILFTSLSLIGCSLIFLLIDSLLKNVNAKYINFPYKKYWLTEERRPQAFVKMAKWTDFFGIMVNLFLLTTFFLVYRANLVTPPQLNSTIFIVFLSLFLLITVIWLIALYISFKPPAE